MAKKARKTIEFVNETDYLEILADAKRNKKNIGDFIVMLHKHWLKTREERE